MKKMILGSVILIAFFQFSCKKDSSNGIYCHEDVTSSEYETLLGDSELNVIAQLFEQNNLDASGLQFYRIHQDNLGYVHVRSNQYVNGLKVFSQHLFFHFKPGGVYYLTSGDSIDHINLDAKAKMSSGQLIRKFKDAWKEDGFYYEERSDCYDIEFGYRDLNAGISYSVPNFTKAWIVKPSNSNYPFAIINDINGEVIHYDNGIRS